MNQGEGHMPRKKYSSEFKARVALEALRETKTLSQLASEYGVHPNLIRDWKADLVKNAKEIYEGPKRSDASANREPMLYEEIGRLKMDLDWLKKKSLELDLWRSVK
jgi:transposase-like protein